MAEGVEEIDLRQYAFRENLFELFCQQLKKDFESCSLDAAFVGRLLPDFTVVKTLLGQELDLVMRRESSFKALLYRIDVSEAMIRTYRERHPTLNFEELITELIIKRTLQKVILKKRFSS